jgi:predicted RNase H-like nuclease (RuvC/YqgF family)
MLGAMWLHCNQTIVNVVSLYNWWKCEIVKFMRTVSHIVRHMVLSIQIIAVALTNVTTTILYDFVYTRVQISVNGEKRYIFTTWIHKVSLQITWFSPQRKSQEDREKGLQQRNSELQTRIKQLEEKISSLNSENESLVSDSLDRFRVLEFRYFESVCTDDLVTVALLALSRN